MLKEEEWRSVGGEGGMDGGRGMKVLGESGKWKGGGENGNNSEGGGSQVQVVVDRRGRE